MCKTKELNKEDKVFILYSTLGCHLCEQAELMLNGLIPLVPSSYGACQIKVIDIANNDRLVSDYGIRIPVLVNQCTGAELAWPFDDEMVEEFLRCSLSLTGL